MLDVSPDSRVVLRARIGTAWWTSHSPINHSADSPLAPGKQEKLPARSTAGEIPETTSATAEELIEV